TLRDVEPAARAIGLQIQVLNASTSREIDSAFASLMRERPDALFVGNDAFFTSRRVQLEAGGLMTYGTKIADAYRQVYEANRQAVVADIVEASLAGQALQSFLSDAARDRIPAA